MGAGADLREPEAIADFRRALIVCAETAQRELDSALQDIQLCRQWLEQERGPVWRREHLRCETRLGEAKIAFTAARGDPSRPCEHEEREFLRARAAAERAEGMLGEIRRWLTRLPTETAEAVAVMRRAQHTLDAAVPRAVARLDEMVSTIDDYHAARTPEPEGGA